MLPIPPTGEYTPPGATSSSNYSDCINRFRSCSAEPRSTPGGELAEEGEEGGVVGGGVLEVGEVARPGDYLEPASRHSLVDRLRLRHRGQHVFRPAHDQGRHADLPQGGKRIGAGGEAGQGVGDPLGGG